MAIVDPDFTPHEALDLGTDQFVVFAGAVELYLDDVTPRLREAIDRGDRAAIEKIQEELRSPALELAEQARLLELIDPPNGGAGSPEDPTVMQPLIQALANSLVLLVLSEPDPEKLLELPIAGRPELDQLSTEIETWLHHHRRRAEGRIDT